MKYLITGITGFAGPHLANLLIKEGHEVYGLVRHSNGREADIIDIVKDINKIKFVYSDLNNYITLENIIKENSFDGIFHLAAQSHPPTSFSDPIGTMGDNVLGSVNLIEAVRKNSPDTKLMFCSTSEVYGNVGRDKRKIKTTDSIMPANPYGSSKAAIDIYLQERFNNNFIRGFITRAFSHTGPRRGRTFSISGDAYQLAHIKAGKDNCIDNFYKQNQLLVGNLDTIRVVMDVRDTVKAYYLLMINDKSDGKVFNVCGDTPHKMGYYTDILIEESNTKVEKIIYEKFYRKFDIDYQHGDCEELKKLTGWREEHKIEDTLKDLFKYWVDKIK